MSPYERPVVRVQDLVANPPPPQRNRRVSGALLRWVVGFLIVVIAVFALAKSIPAAPRPSLGPPSSQVGTESAS